MRLRTLAATALTAPLVALAALSPAAATATAAPAPHSSPAATSVPGEDWSYKCDGSVPLTEVYLCGNEHLGPRYRPVDEPVATLVKEYTPFGKELHSTEFLRRHSFINQQGKFRWNYPDYDGFLTVTHNGKKYPLRAPQTLTVGTYVDRFGGPSGRFISPAGTSFASRSLPPDALNGRLNNYHCYQVTTAFKVDAGPTAPAFEQPGDSIQYHLTYSPTDPDKLAKTTVEDLTTDDQYLAEKSASECAPG
ncbi:TNT domain-containing protein [Streptomyces sp. WMMC1477]|uniref:TNT domain-containing protein n=1 Tax=Streptomyces sp. WMMC1477 TaxID=3015155 RepID=UPI0022B672F8|nr:TNT domain-containing protein [Streptomyces sp. WMMC1477]MCZ7433349.1 TNT domain-containing protein [Streptomyces sp. WMMC1477]